MSVLFTVAWPFVVHLFVFGLHSWRGICTRIHSCRIQQKLGLINFAENCFDPVEVLSCPHEIMQVK